MALYGRTGTITAHPGQREALAQALLGSTAEGMPGCRLYLVATSEEQPDSLFITELWDSAEQHRASLQLPAVQAAIAQARPLIAGMSGHSLDIVGGIGLPR